MTRYDFDRAWCRLVHRYVLGRWLRYVGWGERYRCMECGREW